MGILSKILGNKSNDTSNAEVVKGIEYAESAIIDARSELISVQEMLGKLLTSQVLIPMAAAPVIEENHIKSWNPATVTKQNEETQFLVAFTNKNLATNFYKSNPNHSFEFLITTKWLLSVLPNNSGIIFNLGGESNFEWSAQGIAAFKRQTG